MSATLNDHNLSIHQKDFIRLMNSTAGRFRRHEVFRDFCEMMAIALSNAVDLRQRAEREARYMHIIGRYEKDEIEMFPKMVAKLVDACEANMGDVLGDIFMAMDFGDAWKGQFFTPSPIAELMARLTLGGDDDVRAAIEKKGFIQYHEPACGAGGLVIKAAETIANLGINYQETMHVNAIDIDPTAVHMAYIQLALFHIPAVVVHGNALTMEQWGVWYTPAHIIGGWSFKLKRLAKARDEEGISSLDTMPQVDEPIEPILMPVMPDKKPEPMGRRGDLVQLDLF